MNTMMMQSSGGLDPQQSNQTLFDDMCKLQSLIKHEQNLQQLFYKEKEDYCQKIGNQHIDYYKQQLSYMNEHDMFLQSIQHDQFPHIPMTKIERVLETKPQTHFGEAFKRIQSLLFMLRENEDVYEVFKKNLYKIRHEINGSLAETLTNFMFNDLTHSQGLNKRFVVVMREIIKREVELAETPDQLLRGMTDKIFKELIKQSDARRYITYMFKAKYDRIDFMFLSNKNICKIFDGLMRKSSMEIEQITDVTIDNDGLEFELVNSSTTSNSTLKKGSSHGVQTKNEEDEQQKSGSYNLKPSSKLMERQSLTDTKNNSGGGSLDKPQLIKQTSQQISSSDLRNGKQSLIKYFMLDDRISEGGKSSGQRTISNSSPNHIPISQHTVFMIKNIFEIFDAILEQIMTKTHAMPYFLREFFITLHSELADFLINKWLVPVCFFNLSQNGLTKDFYLSDNSKENLKLMGKIMQKYFKFEELQCHDEAFNIFKHNQNKKKDQIIMFYQSLLDVNVDSIDPIHEDKKQKFSFHSMILNLSDVNVLYEFFKDYMDEFTTSKQAIKNLCQNIDYLDKTYGILSEEPLRADSMIFSSSTIRMANERTMSSIDSLLQKDMSAGVQTRQINYFYFFKLNETQAKKKTDATYQPSPENNYDWSSQLIINSFKNRFCRVRDPSEEFSRFTQLILGGFEKEIDAQTQERNNNISTLLKYSNQMSTRIDQVEQDFKYLELMIKNKKRSTFIQNVAFEFFLYRYEPDEYIELVLPDQKPKHNPYKQNEGDSQMMQKQLMQQQQQEQLAKLKAKEKQTQALEGNLAMKFLLKGGGLDSFMYGKKDSRKKTNAKEELKTQKSDTNNQNNQQQQPIARNSTNDHMHSPLNKEQEQIRKSSILSSNNVNLKSQGSIDGQNHQINGGSMIIQNSQIQGSLIQSQIPQSYKKVKQKIKSIDEFIARIMKLTNILGRVLQQDDIEWGGVKQCFQDFYNLIKQKVQEDQILSRDVDEHMTEIAEYITLRLNKYIYSNKTQSLHEFEVYHKIQSLQWVTPDSFGVPNDPISRPMWELAIRELQNIDRCLTPKTKQNCVYSCFKLIDSSFSLFSTEEGINTACADDMLQIFPYIILKAKIERLIAHINYIKIFDYNKQYMDASAYSFNKLEISIRILMDFNASNLQMSETDFELKIQEASYQNEDFFESQAKQFHEQRLKTKYDQCAKCKKWHSLIESCETHEKNLNNTITGGGSSTSSRTSPSNLNHNNVINTVLEQ
eukprot:403343810